MFQFTPLREGRPELESALFDLYEFQFTPLREGRPYRFRNVSATPKFQFTPLREGRRRSLRIFRRHTWVSIHAPA